MKSLSMVVATSENRCIGKNGKLLYNISEDMRNFRRLTENNIVIMGKNTFESLPNGALPNRLNVVLTTNVEEYKEKVKQYDNVVLFDSLENAIEYCNIINDKEVFVIGGGQVYKQALKYTDKIYLTYVYDVTDGDTFFPELKEDEWNLSCVVEKNEFIHRYEFRIYERIK